FPDTSRTPQPSRRPRRRGRQTWRVAAVPHHNLSLATARLCNFAECFLLVSMANDVHNIAVGCADEEPPRTPRFFSQRVNDLVAAALRLDVRLVDIVTDAHGND